MVRNSSRLSSRGWKRKEIRAVIDGGVAVRGRHFTVRGAVVGDGRGGRAWFATFAIPRSSGNAVTRNKLRRRFKGIVEEMKSKLPRGVRVVVSYRAGATSDVQEVVAELRELLEDLGKQVRVSV